MMARIISPTVVLAAALTATPASAYNGGPLGGAPAPYTEPKLNVYGMSSITGYKAGWVPSGTTNAMVIQDWLNWLYVQNVNYDVTRGLENLDRTSCIEARIPKMKNLYIEGSILIPPGVCTDFKTKFVRNGNTAGAVTPYYNGDPMSQDLANPYQFAVMMTPGSQNLGIIDVIQNTIGTDAGSGIVTGRTWAISALAIANGGTGFVGGETCTTRNGDVNPYVGASFTVTHATSGAADAISFTAARWTPAAGVYPFPLLMQQQLWTAANGWTGARQIFDGSGNYLTNCSSGTGLTVTATPQADWSGGLTYYQGWYDNYSPMYSWLGTLKATQGRDKTDPTYGSTMGILISSFDQHAKSLYSQGNHNGLTVIGTDFWAPDVNSVSDGIGLYVRSGGNINLPNVVLGNDTIKYLDIDDNLNTYIRASMSTDTQTTPTAGPYAVGLGQNSIQQSQENSGLNLDLNFTNAGSAGGIPAIACAYTVNSNIRVNIGNIRHNNLVYAGPISSVVNFGTDCQGSNKFSGSIDNVTGPLYTGTPPNNLNWDILDAAFPIQPGTNTLTIGGSVTTGDTVAITFTNANLAGLPVSASYTAAGGDSTTTIATALAAAINANSTLASNNIIATSSGAVVTTSEAGTWTKLTTISYVQGSNTETVAPSNSGVPSGSANGAVSTGPGIYRGYSPMAPTAQTGIGKAGPGSMMINSSTGREYIDSGPTSAPSWGRGLFSASPSALSLSLDGVLAGPVTGSTHPGLCAAGVACILGTAYNVAVDNTTDHLITIAPLTSNNVGQITTATKYTVLGFWIDGCSGNVGSLAAGLYTATSKGGTALVASSQTYSACNATTAGASATMNAGGGFPLSTGALYWSPSVAGTAGATANLHVWGIPYN